MRPPRLLALLLALAALLAFGAWRIVGVETAADAGAPAPASVATQVEPAALEGDAAESRLPARADASAQPPGANSSRIRGRVVRGPNQLPVAGIEVRCTKQLAPTRIEGPIVLRDDGRTLIGRSGPLPEAPRWSATSGPDGRFAFEALEAGALYDLTARAPGWVLVEPLAGLAPAEDERTLALSRIYVARVLATDERGDALLGEPEYLRYARTAEPGDCESKPLEGARARDWREPPPAPGLEGAPPPPGREYRFSSDCDAPRLGPFRILILSTGFERQDFEFWAYPEGLAADTTVLRLRRVAEQVGLLRLNQECGCAGSSCEHLLEGRVELEPLEGQPKRLEFDLSGLVREQVFGNIPVGRWRLHARALVGGFAWEGEITIAAEPLTIQLPVRNLGAIRWKLRGPGDALASESLPVLWRDPAGTEVKSNLWMSVVMRGIPAGGHDFEVEAGKFSSVENAFATERGGIVRIQVDVVAGETKTVIVHAR